MVGLKSQKQQQQQQQHHHHQPVHSLSLSLCHTKTQKSKFDALYGQNVAEVFGSIAGLEPMNGNGVATKGIELWKSKRMKYLLLSSILLNDDSFTSLVCCVVSFKFFILFRCKFLLRDSKSNIMHCLLILPWFLRLFACLLIHFHFTLSFFRLPECVRCDNDALLIFHAEISDELIDVDSDSR